MASARRSSIENPALADLISGARDMSVVAGLTHTFYKYPARFSPAFARAAIKTFSKPGDWILDPFAGGGTTLVEAIVSGRNAIGVDISSLATFVSEAKTLVLNQEELDATRRWIERLPHVVNIHKDTSRFNEYADAGYYRNLDGVSRWRLRKAIEQILLSIIRLKHDRAKILARCVLLRTAQWALDGRKSAASIDHFKTELLVQAEEMLSACAELSATVKSQGAVRAVCLNRSAVGMEEEKIFGRVASPRLVLTSPPYPGIHVLYHRWQVDGGKEAPAPFWIANRLDGAGASYYTMGDRKSPGLQSYFENLKATYSSIARVCGHETILVQMVAFSEPDWQLSEYLSVMQDCGFAEITDWDDNALERGRLWRDVPNRKWHARQRRHSPGAREVVLIHGKRRSS